MKHFRNLAAVLVIAVLCLTFLSGCFETEGKSAYDLAVENGYEGSVEEWLESLKGNDGADGQDGSNGSNGKDGKDGKDATDISLNELYDEYLKYYPDATFDEFLESFKPSQDYSIRSVILQTMRSVVAITCTFERNIPLPQQSAEETGAGAGVIYKIDGDDVYIITNYHVVYNKDYNSSTNGITTKINIYTYGKEITNDKFAISAEYVGGSISKDIAIIKTSLADLPSYVLAAEIADDFDVSVGEEAIAVGNPSGAGIAVSLGIISRESENIVMDSLDGQGEVVTRVIRTDAPISPGNSGGGLFDNEGRLIGIVNAKSIAENVEGMGYAIPVSVAKGVAECVLNNNSQKAYLGVTIEIDDVSTVYNSNTDELDVKETIKVSAIDANSLVIGHMQLDDIIVSAWLNDTTPIDITRLFFLPEYLYYARIGDTLHVELIRNNQTIIVDIVLAQSCFKAA